MLPVRVVASTAPKAQEAVADAQFLELALPSGTPLRGLAGTDRDYVRRLAAAFWATVLTHEPSTRTSSARRA
jgi:hypothetical protein